MGIRGMRRRTRRTTVLAMVGVGLLGAADAPADAPTGILTVTGNRDLCRASHLGATQATGQNGKEHDVLLGLSTPACRSHR